MFTVDSLHEPAVSHKLGGSSLGSGNLSIKCRGHYYVNAITSEIKWCVTSCRPATFVGLQLCVGSVWLSAASDNTRDRILHICCCRSCRSRPSDVLPPYLLSSSPAPSSCCPKPVDSTAATLPSRPHPPKPRIKKLKLSCHALRI